jgi:hypothetical protein
VDITAEFSSGIVNVHAEAPNLRAKQRRRHRGESRAERRLGARLFGALRTVGNPDHGGADSGETVFLCIVGARRELPHMPRCVSPQSGASRSAA